MNKLQEARLKINEIDSKMAELFEERMKAVEGVVAYKIENDMAIFDSTREKEVIENNVSLIKNTGYRPYFKQLLEDMMKVSKEYQKQIINDSKKER